MRDFLGSVVGHLGLFEAKPTCVIHGLAIVSKAIYYFIPSLVAIVRGICITHEDRVSVL